MEEDLVQEIGINTQPANEELKKVNESLEKIINSLNDLSSKVSQGFGGMQKEAEEASAALEDFGNKGSNSGKKISEGLVGVVGALAAITLGAKNLLTKSEKFMEQGNAVTETANLYYQSLSNVADAYKDGTDKQSIFYKQGLAYQKDLHTQLGLNTEQMERYQAMYFNMLNGQSGISSELAYQMSENLTNMAIDMSSLFNTDVDTMTKKLQSGITGQAKALREFGIDVTEASMASTLLAYGIDESVKSLSYGEKELVRYLTIVRQVNYAQGDFANTYNTSANQLKVLHEEIKTLAQSVGLIFSQTLSGAIVFARAVVRVFQQMVEVIARFFHVDLTGTAENEGKAINGITDKVNNGIGGIGKSIGNATKKAKEFKKQLMGFDEINNITPPGQSAGGGGGGLSGGAGGINSGILDALSNADWDLGIGKTVEDLNKKVEKLANNPFVKLVAGGLLVGGLALLAGGFLKLKNAIGGVLPSLSGLFSKSTEAQGGLTGLQGAILAAEVALAAFEIVSLISNFDRAKEKMEESVRVVDQLNAITGETVNVFEALGNVVAIPFLAIGMGVDDLTNNWFSKLGASWGDTMANMTKGTGWFVQETENNLHNIQKTFEETSNANKATIDTMTGSSKSYLAELDKMVDTNGRIKKGYEDIAGTLVGKLAEATGMQIEVAGNQIKLNGEVISSYDQLKTAVDEQIKLKEKELTMKALEAEYTALIEERAKVYVKLQEAIAEYNAAVDAGDEHRIETAKNTMQTIDTEYRNLSKNINETSKEITSQTAKDMNALTAEMIKNRQVNSKTVQEIYKTNKDSWKQTLSELDADTKGELLSLTTSFDTLDQDLADDWKSLAKSSEDGAKAFNNELLMMDDTTRIKLLSMSGNFEDLDEDAKKSIADFANTSPEKYEQALSGMKGSTREQFQAMVNSINNKKGELSNASTAAANKIEEPITKTRDKGSTWGNDFIKNLARGILWGVVPGGALFGAVSSVVSLIKNKLGHSVPKEGDLHDDDKWGLHFIQNLANGIKNNEGILDKAVQGITTIMSEPFTSNEGIVVDKNVNANSMVDYSAVTGQIKTSINSGNIAEGIAVAVQQALRRANINVNVEAHADAGIIVETAVEGINNITRQTNEFPLEIPI